MILDKMLILKRLFLMMRFNKIQNYTIIKNNYNNVLNKNLV